MWLKFIVKESVRTEYINLFRIWIESPVNDDKWLKQRNNVWRFYNDLFCKQTNVRASISGTRRRSQSMPIVRRSCRTLIWCAVCGSGRWRRWCQRQCAIQNSRSRLAPASMALSLILANHPVSFYIWFDYQQCHSHADMDFASPKFKNWTL